MADLTSAERERLAIEVMGWHRGWAFYSDGRGPVLKVTNWLPAHNIEQAFGLLDAMHLRDWWESITAIIDDNTYMVKLLHYPTQRLVGWRQTTREYTICIAVLAALEVK